MMGDPKDDMSEHAEALLCRAKGGDAKARDELFNLLYAGWRRRAHGMMKAQRRSPSMETGDYLHQALIPAFKHDVITQASSVADLHFHMTRGFVQALIQHAKKRKSDKRGGKLTRADFDEALKQKALKQFKRVPTGIEGVVAELEALEGISPRYQQLGGFLRLQIFGGFPVKDIADLMKISLHTVEKGLHTIRMLLEERLADAGMKQSGRRKRV